VQEVMSLNVPRHSERPLPPSPTPPMSSTCFFPPHFKFQPLSHKRAVTVISLDHMFIFWSSAEIYQVMVLESSYDGLVLARSALQHESQQLSLVTSIHGKRGCKEVYIHYQRRHIRKVNKSFPCNKKWSLQ
jgi:hypothetical protein